MSDLPSVDYYLDETLFRDAIRFTAAETDISEWLIVKNYYCSTAIQYLCPLGGSELVFKGGTSLSEIHAAFFRLSEDLDFAISTPTDTT